MKKAIFPGSFDPFTLGHQSIVERALTIFDEVIIAVGINSSKKSYLSADERVAAVKELYKDDERIKVEQYDILTADFAAACGATHIVRGVRSVADYEYERTIAQANYTIFGIDTILFFADTDKEFLSSSLLRELKSYGHDIEQFLPKKNRINYLY